MRSNLRAYVGDVDAAAVPCGFGRAIGNKVRFPLLVAIYLGSTRLALTFSVSTVYSIKKIALKIGL